MERSIPLHAVLTHFLSVRGAESLAVLDFDAVEVAAFPPEAATVWHMFAVCGQKKLGWYCVARELRNGTGCQKGAIWFHISRAMAISQ